MDHAKRPGELAGNSGTPKREAEPGSNPEVDEFFRRLKHEMRWPKPSRDALAAALHAMQRLGVESDAEDMVNNSSMPPEPPGRVCPSCGNPNREVNKFCAMCGTPLAENQPSGVPALQHPAPTRTSADGNYPSASHSQHHYHHHYHHHFFPAAAESGYQEPGLVPRPFPAERPAKDTGPMRAPLSGPAISRAEATVRKLTQDLALACNTKQLDDLVDLYAADALVLRSNTPPVRGAAAIREFFFAALDSGLGEVEMEALRVDVMGDVAYEAGRCKMLVPFAMGKRREERGKYLIIYIRRAPGEWKVVADCWSSDLGLNVAAEAEPARSSQAPRPGVPRKSA